MSQAFEIICPVCGTKQQGIYTTCTTKYLDGVSMMPMSQLLQMVTICPKCSMICTRQNEIPNPAIRLQRHGYQEAIHAEYASLEEQKIALLEAMYNIPYAPLYRAHYYHEMNDLEQEQKWLQIAIQRVLDKEDFTYCTVEPSEWTHIHLRDTLTINPQLRLIDLYRRTGQFDKAMQEIQYFYQKYNNRPSYDLATYLQYEQKLIQQNDTSLR